MSYKFIYRKAVWIKEKYPLRNASTIPRWQYKLLKYPYKAKKKNKQN